MMEPVLAQLEDEYGDKVDFISYNVVREREKTSRYGISVTPTFIFLDAAGKEAARLTGYQPEEAMRSHMESLLAQ